MTRLERLRALERAATPGRWAAHQEYIEGQVPEGRPGGEYICRMAPTVRRLLDIVPNEANATLIAEARNALPALLDVAEAAQRVQETAREVARRDRPNRTRRELREAIEAIEAHHQAQRDLVTALAKLEAGS